MDTFYEPKANNGIDYLSEEESRHCAVVLRHEVGDKISVMDGQGTVISARLREVNKKRCEFEILSSEKTHSKPFRIHLAIAPTKNIDRIEWMIEKLGEMGIDEITFLKTEHSERGKIRIDRMQKKALSAMKQCKWPFLMDVNELTPFEKFLKESQSDEKWIAHVDDSHSYLGTLAQRNRSATLLIGPEGDFSSNEVELAKKHGFVPVSLGQTTLRTETAGLAACHLVNVVNEF